MNYDGTVSGGSFVLIYLVLIYLICRVIVLVINSCTTNRPKLGGLKQQILFQFLCIRKPEMAHLGGSGTVY